MYAVVINSDFDQLHRYDFIITCAGYDAEGKQLYVEGIEGSLLECGEAHSIRVIIYAVANALPEDRLVENSPPFELYVTVTRYGEVVHNEPHDVNQWGGATIYINIA